MVQQKKGLVLKQEFSFYGPKSREGVDTVPQVLIVTFNDWYGEKRGWRQDSKKVKNV
jgi:hypothetical protein